MGFHTFDAAKAEKLEDDAARYRNLSAEELLWAIEPAPTDVVADLGSGTGFYTDDVAPHVDTVYGVDVQAEMHEFYREKGVPENVDLITTEVGDLPFDDDELDAAFSTMTYHEFASDAALAELARVVVPGGRVVVADWSGDGAGAHGPSVEERYTPDEATAAFEAAGFAVEFVASRPDTFLLVAVAP
ncbi:MAG: class I SAM-dependent methyltransferase [Haloferacaceae archaeon]